MNPSPGQFRGMPVPYRPPGSIKVLGILNLVFAGLGAIGMVFTYAMYFGGLRLGPRNPVIEIAHSSPEYMSFLQWSIILGSIGLVVFATSGVGLLVVRPWGRKLALIYGAYGIFSAIIGLVATQHYVLGPLSRSHDDLASSGGYLGGYMGGILGLVYPIILLAFMRKANVRAAFERAAMPIPPARVL